MTDQNILDKSMRSVFGMCFVYSCNSMCNIFYLSTLFYMLLVGNIPYEATEEKLKDIFCEVGPVISFKYNTLINLCILYSKLLFIIIIDFLPNHCRLVYDRETGKPKGYGFCEYKDQETALSAMRNLNGHEIGGRTLRVDNACTEKSRLEMQCNHLINY